ncbi:hypothetical protein ASPWEDRAFT_69350 [Aspergillus wentii DTO 134E9]|uniref:Uncharacterized protein n=1 Tax=Aspergillus wentii DTO 134E9 TaxID=1073089 RepID=A0A1L9RMH6_ASPWE|nr:uncharacterized protein ASPWEDRAFT_69350 [Aspergillus wentii DTO 134E9]OJJ36136.1 hypothetical protein ASPWEDRAFT_69350 [Aspergillus wentii DTO 134E9]
MQMKMMKTSIYRIRFSTLCKILLNVNMNGGEHTYSLHAACAKSNIELVQLVLEYGADSDIKGHGIGNTLYAAYSKGQSKRLHLLLQYGANPNVHEEFLGSTFHSACQ